MSFGGRTVIVVDDGLATGFTVLAAIRAVRRGGAARTIVAAPVGSPEAIALLREDADRIVYVSVPQRLYGAGRYEDFSQSGPGAFEQKKGPVLANRPFPGAVTFPTPSLQCSLLADGGGRISGIYDSRAWGEGRSAPAPACGFLRTALRGARRCLMSAWALTGRIAPVATAITRPERISKRPADAVLAPNMSDYEHAGAAFTWEVARRALDGLPDGRTQHRARGGRPPCRPLAPRRGRAAFARPGGETVDISFAQLRGSTNRFAHALRALGLRRGERLFALTGRVPELYVAALGALKQGCVFSPALLGVRARAGPRG